MAGINEMTKLLNKAERRLGLSVIKLPEQLAKDKWADIVREDTLPTYSRYFPYMHVTVIDVRYHDENGFFYIDRDLPEGTKIIGVKDIDWSSYRADSGIIKNNINYGTWDFAAAEYGAADIAMSQARTDYCSLFNLGIYIEEVPPNKIKLVSVNGSPVNQYSNFPIAVFIEQPDNLLGISPTMMETFEKLAFSDIATFLYNNLKYYDGTDTVFATLDLKLDLLNEWANKRDDIVNQLDEAHVSTANANQTMIMCV